MTSQTGEQTIIIHILPNISQNKDNQTIVFGQVIKYYKMFFFKNYEVARLVLDLFVFFKKTFYEVKASGL